MAWDTWRCPTCLTVLPESTAKRCPACHSKLRKSRAQPIVLGNTSRLDLQATLPIDRQNRKRLERGHWNVEHPAPIPERFRRAEAEPTPPLPELEAWLEFEPEPVNAAPEPEVASLSREIFVPAEPAPVTWFDEPGPRPVFEPVAFAVDAKRAELTRDVNSVVDALHRKARGRPPRRSLRLMASAPSNRRRRNTELKSRRNV